MLFLLYCVIDMSPWMLIRDARTKAGLTQSALALRAGTTQAAIARLERPGANPRFSTLQQVLAAAGRRLEVTASDRLPENDETLIATHMRMTPAERAAYHDSGYRNLRKLVQDARRLDG
jgi:transcriptional regulator with XRE-family HTH domain